MTKELINVDGTVGRDDLINFVKNGKLIIQFSTVTGHFFCCGLGLTTLEGCPKIVDKSFYCNDNKLTSLEGGPREVGGDFCCYGNKLTSLEGAPETIGHDFHCYDNPDLINPQRPPGVKCRFYE